jgi:hypothetical protein
LQAVQSKVIGSGVRRRRIPSLPARAPSFATDERAASA